MAHILDRPVWSALTTRQAALAEGGALARRFPPAIIPFAAARDRSAESLAALGALAGPGEEIVQLEADEPAVPPSFVPVVAAPVVQMVLADPPAPVADPRIEKLSEADAPEMLELATLTRPGPFTLRAQALGDFFGVRIGGRLAAMTGERMKVDGYSEVSGVCSHPDFRGKGLARLLSVHVTRRLLDRGETPYLHAWASNTAAIRLYETIGFRVRATLNAVMARRG
ncbi:MAG TPA: GNAT family N-acetyltransferase [Bauldia sp.]|nr:GNAT family N-acetyltransferase [Bauldia sp.]